MAEGNFASILAGHSANIESHVPRGSDDDVHSTIIIYRFVELECPIPVLNTRQPCTLNACNIKRGNIFTPPDDLQRKHEVYLMIMALAPPQMSERTPAICAGYFFFLSHSLFKIFL